MTAFIKHPLLLPKYKTLPAFDKPLDIAVAKPCQPVGFWQSMAFIYTIALILVVVFLLWLTYYQQMYHLIGTFGLLFIAGSDFQRDFDSGYRLPIPFLGNVSQCYASPLVVLDDKGLYWHKKPINTRSNQWTFDLNDSDGIHRVDMAGYGLVVYFADTVSLEGTPFLTNSETLLISTNGGHQCLSQEQFCTLVNQRAYHFREQQNSKAIQ